MRLLNERVITRHLRFRAALTADNEHWLDLGTDWSCEPVVKDMRIPATSKWEDVESMISSLYTKRFDYHAPGLPLWRLYLIDGFEEGKQVLFWKFHHALGDGASMGAVLARHLADDFPPHIQLERGPGLWRIIQVLFWLWWGTIFVVLRWLKSATFYQRQPTIMTGVKLTGTKRLCNSADGIVSVDEAKAIGKESNATVNDVVLAAVSRALGTLTGEPHRSLAVAVPVNLRLSTADLNELHNRFGSISLFLPLADAKAESFVKTSKRVSKVMQRAKRYPEAFVGAGVLMLSHTFLPQNLQRRLFDWFCTKIKCSISNVKGTEEALHYGGVLCESMIGFVPPPNSIGLGIAITSYRGQVFVSVLSDVAVLPEPRRLLNLITAELRAAAQQVENGKR